MRKLAVVLALMAATSAHAAAEYVVNGNFGPPVSATWELTSGFIDFSSGLAVLASSGINQGTEVTLTQNILGLTNGTYLLQFDAIGAGFVDLWANEYALQTTGVLPSDATTVPRAFGAGLNSFSFSVTDAGCGTCGVSTHLAFWVPVGGIASIDNVSITTAIPEPETYAMMFAGLGVLGAMSRRQNKA